MNTGRVITSVCVACRLGHGRTSALFETVLWRIIYQNAKDPRGNKLPFLAVRRKPSGAAKPEGLRPTASFNPVIYFRAAPKD